MAYLSGLPREVAGNPVDFSDSKWVLGGAIQTGLTYRLDSTWFIDVNYTYAISKKYSNDYSAPYATTLIGDYADVGTIFVNTKRQIKSQALSVTINKTL